MEKKTFTPMKTLYDDRKVRIFRYGDYIDIMQSSQPSATECPIQRLDNDRILVKSTGEIKTIKHAQNKSQCTESVRQSLQRLRDLINANVTDPRCAKWITLTYGENMTDTAQLLRDIEKFIKRFKYARVAPAENWRYIMAVEPQGRGAWHAHVLFIWDRPAPFIPNAEMARIWGHGFTVTKKLDDVDNIGVYLTAYLGDMELDAAEKIGNLSMDDTLKIIEENGKSKAFVKGARLRLYPPKMHIYRASRNCQKPDIDRKLPDKFEQRIVRNMTPKHAHGVQVKVDGKAIRYSYYTFRVTADDDLYYSCDEIPCRNLPFPETPEQLVMDLHNLEYKHDIH